MVGLSRFNTNPMTKFFKSGNTFRLAPGESVDVRDELPVGNYTVKFNPMAGFWLETCEPFKMPSKIYGSCLRNSERILNTFRSRQGNTGVMLVGEKGSGKTLLARQISINSGMPVIIVNNSYTGDDFNSFLSAITQPSVVVFDEFEKVYDKESQEKILTLLDGTYQSQKLFLLTSNDKWKLDSNMKNRPGRIFYLIEFDGLDEEFIREFCQDRLIDKSKTESILKISSLFDKFNFDMLTAIVEEINRYGESPEDLISILNAKPEYSGRSTYTATLFLNGQPVPRSAIYGDNHVYTNTSNQNFTITVWFTWKDEVDNKMGGIISRDIDSSQVNAETLTEWIQRGYVVPGRDNPEWENEETSSDYMNIECAPEEIIKYEGTSIFYKTEEGFEVRLTKYTGKKSRKSPLRDYD